MTRMNVLRDPACRQYVVLVCGVLVLCCAHAPTTTALPVSLPEELKRQCPSLSPKIHNDTVLAGGIQAGMVWNLSILSIISCIIMFIYVASMPEAYNLTWSVLYLITHTHSLI